jgi:hypothetical protein
MENSRFPPRFLHSNESFKLEALQRLGAIMMTVSSESLAASGFEDVRFTVTTALRDPLESRRMDQVPQEIGLDVAVTPSPTSRDGPPAAASGAGIITSSPATLAAGFKFISDS